jgi:hypothetical protein
MGGLLYTPERNMSDISDGGSDISDMVVYVRFGPGYI